MWKIGGVTRNPWSKVAPAMRPLPVADPGTPDHRSATRYLWWLARHQLDTIGIGMFFGIAWMLSGAFMPYVLGRGIDAGVVDRDLTSLAQWAGVFLLLAAAQTTCGLMRHRNAVFNFLSGVVPHRPGRDRPHQQARRDPAQAAGHR